MTGGRAIPRHARVRWRYLGLRGPSGPAPRAWDQTLNLFWARNGICRGLREFGVVPGAIVLVPSFACRSVPEAVAASGATVEFYDVDASGRADPEVLRKRIRAGVRGVLVIHYFSCLQPHMTEIRGLCDRHGLWLIEDCAHLLPESLRPGAAGSFGDLSIFSWRKFLPVYDGGGLLSRGRTTSGRSALSRQAGVELRAAKDVVDRWRHARRTRTGTIEPRPDAAPGPAKRPPGAARDPNSDAFDAQLLDLPMSHVSECILRHSDPGRIVDARQRNWRQLHHRVIGLGVIKPWGGEPPAGHGPWAYAMEFPGIADAHKALRRMGLPAATWEGVRPAALPPGQFPEAERLYRELVFLPVHQDLGSPDIESIAQALERVALPGRGPRY